MDEKYLHLLIEHLNLQRAYLLMQRELNVLQMEKVDAKALEAQTQIEAMTKAT
jgi:hypothetical protein